MTNEDFEKQKGIIESGIKEKRHSKEYYGGYIYINAIYDYNLITDNQFCKLYGIIYELDKGGRQ